MKRQLTCVHNTAVLPELGVICEFRKPNSLCRSCKSYKSKNPLYSKFVHWIKTFTTDFRKSINWINFLVFLTIVNISILFNWSLNLFIVGNLGCAICLIFIYMHVKTTKPQIKRPSVKNDIRILTYEYPNDADLGQHVRIYTNNLKN